MKKFAYFLPQFHVIPENNEWWGEGFTEWTNVRKAEALFKGHRQPMHPLNDNYYNLLDIKTMEWQSKLMKQYGLDGFIYYHYYFCGKMLLEKPAEILLEHKEISQPFFFCWANHSWLRTWNGTREVLIEQKYGEIDEWERHFQYLLNFFKDERYEKKDNKPLFMVFKSKFKEKDDIFSYFNKRCCEEGFSGIYLIETYHGEIPWEEFKNDLSAQTSMVHYREPAVSMNGFEREKGKIIQIIDTYIKKIRNRGYIKKPQIIKGTTLMRYKVSKEKIGIDVGHGIWFEWDNTPRHKGRGYIITPFDKELFIKYMSCIKNDEYLFINAWNEWCEGMILEPTKENGYKYLEWIKEWNEINDIP